MNRFSLPSFTPLIDWTNDKTHLWNRGIIPKVVIIPYTQLMAIINSNVQQKLFTLVDMYPLQIIIQLPSELNYSLPLISKPDLEVLKTLPLTAVMMGFSIDSQDYPNAVTNRAVRRSLNQLDLLVNTCECPIIPSLPGATFQQLNGALSQIIHYEEQSSIHFPYVALRGGLYTFIKLHSRVNTYLKVIHNAQFTPLLYWDVWWIPSRFLNVNHFFGASWWQFGLHRFKFVRRRHYGYRYCSPTQIANVTTIIDQNYQYLATRIEKRVDNRK
jgi:hypothetical protein